MKYVLSLMIALFLMGQKAYALDICVASAPNGKRLPVHDSPSSSGPVLGHIKVGACGVKETNQCEGSMCVIVYRGLNGWVEMAHLPNSDVLPPGLLAKQKVTARYVYSVTGGKGTVTVGGIKQAMPIQSVGEIQIMRENGPFAKMTMPSEVTSETINLHGKGKGPWEGGFASWGGLPTDGHLSLVGLGDNVAKLTMRGRTQIGKFSATLNLKARSLPRTAGQVPRKRDARKKGDVQRGRIKRKTSTGTACKELKRISALINRRSDTPQIQKMRGIYTLSGMIRMNGEPGEADCKKALQMIGEDPELVRLAKGEPSQKVVRQPTTNKGQVPKPKPSKQQTSGSSNQHEGLLEKACIILQPHISAVMRGQSRSHRAQTLAILAGVGVVSVSSAEPRQCAHILAALITSGLIANDNRPWAVIAEQAVPMQGGEDPNSMIAGGREIGIHPSDFIDEFDPASSPSSQRVLKSGTSVGQTGSPCLTLGNALVQTLREGNLQNISSVTNVLRQRQVDNLAPSAAKACSHALADLRQMGLLP